MVMVHSAQEQNTYKKSAILNQTDDVITDDMSDTMAAFSSESFKHRNKQPGKILKKNQ